LGRGFIISAVYDIINTMLIAILKTMRLRQWSKNIFVFGALVFDRQISLSNLDPALRTLAGFFLFYILNDIVDREADRQHPKKRNRPIASGKLPVPIAFVVAGILLVVTLGLSYLLAPGFALVGLVYFVLNLAYSNWLKHIPILDVLVIAAGFVLRVAAGVSLIVVERFSPWLYVVMSLLALYLGFGKRRAELSVLAESAHTHRKVLDGYTIQFLDQLIIIVSCATLIAYSLYTFLAPNVSENHAMMLTIPFVIYSIFRWLYLVQVKQMGGAPEDMLLSDRPLQIAVVLWAISVILILYVFK
jgi:4-hydroxybenzoate polyprenyltransferase